MSAEFDEWLKWFNERPPTVQAAILLWPPRDQVIMHNVCMYVVGWTETERSERSHDPYDIMLMVSPIHPDIDYQASINSVVHICPRHLAPIFEDGETLPEN